MSPSTVSNALNGRSGVDPLTRDRVKRVAHELGYHANASASRLRTGRTGTMGLVLPTIADPGYAAGIYYYSRMTAAAAEAAFKRGYMLSVVPGLQSDDAVRKLPLDGAVIADPPGGDPTLAAFRASGLPVVTIERDPNEPENPWWVGAETVTNTRTVLDHLAALGSRKVALVGRSDHTWTNETDQAYVAWCRERGQEPLKCDLPITHSDEQATGAIRELLSPPDRPDAIFAAPEWFATAAVRAARSMGITVPGELRIATGSDGDRAYDCDPPVTALDLHPGEVATAAVELLLAQIEQVEVMHPRVVHATLNVRASTNPAAGRGPVPS